MATSINRIGTAGILLAVAMCCGASGASAQFYLNVGPGAGNTQAGFGTANIGLGGPGSATAVQGLNEPVIGSNQGVSVPLAGKPLGLNGNPSGAAQGSLSSAGDHPSSPVDSVTNTLMGPVSTLVPQSTKPAANPAGKRKQTSNAGASAAVTQHNSAVPTSR